MLVLSVVAAGVATVIVGAFAWGTAVNWKQLRADSTAAWVRLAQRSQLGSETVSAEDLHLLDFHTLQKVREHEPNARPCYDAQIVVTH